MNSPTRLRKQNTCFCVGGGAIFRWVLPFLAVLCLQAQEGVRTDLNSLGIVLHGHFMEHGQRFQAVKMGKRGFCCEQTLVCVCLRPLATSTGFLLTF